MDLITHAIVGAAVGAVAGHPLLGAAGAIAPDLVLGIKRVAAPTALYRFTHAPLNGMAAALLVLLLLAPSLPMAAVWLGWVSHIVLDMPTHGSEWGPRWFTSSKKPIYNNGEEWEWFNRSWFLGLHISIVWVVLCLAISK